ncbi:hypothetical protein NQ315_002807 [Exocentrus adspersus]|uniref:Uncharacterized protein n=1 Tax=Exocentrus adspersus TaxID=1586481 RepID=A0AAV8VK44_9CUCU|nr:hypothetical protein NQ315_002807 [Exocentrus adspersus]
MTSPVTSQSEETIIAASALLSFAQGAFSHNLGRGAQTNAAHNLTDVLSLNGVETDATCLAPDTNPFRGVTQPLEGATEPRSAGEHDDPVTQQPYQGPYKVIKRSTKTYKIDVEGSEVTVSIGRLKPAHILTTPEAADGSRAGNVIEKPDEKKIIAVPNPGTVTTRSGRKVRFTTPYQHL